MSGEHNEPRDAEEAECVFYELNEHLNVIKFSCQYFQNGLIIYCQSNCIQKNGLTGLSYQYIRKAMVQTQETIDLLP